MNFVFENFKNLEIFDDPSYRFFMAIREGIGNFLDHNTDYGYDCRFGFSEFVSNILQTDKTTAAYKIENAPNKYVISVRVACHPYQWLGKSYLYNGWVGHEKCKHHADLFDALNPKYIEDLQNGNAILLFDQSHEGYQVDAIWKCFHIECLKFKIDPRAIVFVTGNLDAVNSYARWRRKNSIVYNELKVIPVSIFDKFIIDHNSAYKCNFPEIVQYKKLNDIKLFDCLNYNLGRLHRVINYLNLVKHEYDSKGYITMPVIEYAEYQSESINKKLPLVLDSQFENNDTRFIRVLNKLYMNTWVSLVTEASYFESEDSIFISEKMFKPMLCMQPFIVVGSKNTLSKLRELGYKTFESFIDESYDTLDDEERFEKIIEALKKIDKIEDKIQWYKDMFPILKHNYNLLRNSAKGTNSSFNEFKEYYNRYLHEK